MSINFYIDFRLWHLPSRGCRHLPPPQAGWRAFASRSAFFGCGLSRTGRVSHGQPAGRFDLKPVTVFQAPNFNQAFAGSICANDSSCGRNKSIPRAGSLTSFGAHRWAIIGFATTRGHVFWLSAWRRWLGVVLPTACCDGLTTSIDHQALARAHKCCCGYGQSDFWTEEEHAFGDGNFNFAAGGRPYRRKKKKAGRRLGRAGR